MSVFQEKFLRRPDVLAMVGVRKTSLDTAIADGIFPPPIKLLGARAVGWVASEVEAVIQARLTGRSNDDVRALVAGLVSNRGHR